MKASLQLQPMYCSRDYNYSSRFNQQYEKPTQYSGHWSSWRKDVEYGLVVSCCRFRAISLAVLLGIVYNSVQISLWSAVLFNYTMKKVNPKSLPWWCIFAQVEDWFFFSLRLRNTCHNVKKVLNPDLKRCSETELDLNSLSWQAFATRHGCFFWPVWENVLPQDFQKIMFLIIFDNLYHDDFVLWCYRTIIELLVIIISIWCWLLIIS